MRREAGGGRRAWRAVARVVLPEEVGPERARRMGWWRWWVGGGEWGEMVVVVVGEGGGEEGGGGGGGGMVGSSLKVGMVGGE